MKIEILNDVFSQGEFTDFSHLISICLHSERHRILCRYHKIARTENFEKLHAWQKELLILYYTADVQGVKITPNARISQSNAVDVFNLDEGIRYLSEPVYLIVENSLNDAYFLEALVKFLSKDTQLDKHINRGWLKFENGGGCDNVENVIEQLEKAFRHLPKDNFKYLRCYVLLDSDKEYSTAPLKQSYQNLVPILEQKGIKFHILHKRAMENYLPDEVFEKIEEIPKAYRNAYLSLTDEQKDFISIQRGFGQLALRGDMHPEIAKLYHSVSTANFEILNQGAKMSKFKAEYPKKMEHYNVHQKTLKQRTAHQPNPNELDQILSEIENLL
ncbi:hypothetical protein [Mucilaginibacter sp. 22184]|uniref:hypothetical protein n=1 Tax=Mucilaginibacter sp. 22184 TaxID=3453887 RepID=UPI003F82A5A0